MSTKAIIEALDKRKTVLRPIKAQVLKDSRDYDQIVRDGYVALRLHANEDPRSVDLAWRSLFGEHFEDRCGYLKLDIEVLQMLVITSVATLVGRGTLSHDKRLNLMRVLGRKAVEVLKAHPEVAHPVLEVPVLNRRQSRYAPLFSELVASCVQIDPDDLQEACAERPELQDLIGRCVRNVEGASLIAAMASLPESSDLPRALLRVVPDCWRQFDAWSKHRTITYLASRSCLTHQWLTATSAFLDELRLAMTVTNGADAAFTPMRAPGWLQPMDAALKGEESPFDQHPVLALIYMALEASAHNEEPRDTDAAGTASFPERPLAELSECINALLRPEDRLPLERIPARVLLELVALTPRSRNSIPISNFQSWVRNNQPFPIARSPLSFYDWAVARTDSEGRQAQLADIDIARYEAAIGPAATARMVSQLTARSMDRLIDGRHDGDVKPAEGLRARNRLV